MLKNSWIILVLALCGASILGSDADAGHRGVELRGIVVDIDYRAREMTVLVERGDREFRVPVQVPPDTFILEVDRDGRTRIRFTDLMVRDRVNIRGVLRRDRSGVSLVARLIVRSNR